jgi:hypothetical protein
MILVPKCGVAVEFLTVRISVYSEVLPLFVLAILAKQNEH